MRQALLLLVRLLARLLPPRDRTWGDAAAREAGGIASLGGLARWVAGTARFVIFAWRRRLASVRRGALIGAASVGLVAAAVAIAHVHDSGRQASTSLPRGAALVAGAGVAHPRVGIAHHGAPYGASIRRLRDLTAAWLQCEYGHGARRVRLAGASFRVVGVTRKAQLACASRRAAAVAIQHTQAYADDAVATTELAANARACVQAQDISLSGARVGLAELACKLRIEQAQHIDEPAPLP